MACLMEEMACLTEEVACLAEERDGHRVVLLSAYCSGHLAVPGTVTMIGVVRSTHSQE